jgi:GNAT superfamily N-acetyltransferase
MMTPPQPHIRDRLRIEQAVRSDVPTILSLIKELAAYEKLLHEVSATQEVLEETLFGERAFAEVVLARLDDTPVGYALFFHSFSTFLGRPGMYLEDVYIRPSVRGRGIGKSLLVYLARLAVERKCARFEWSVLNWNEPSIGFYKSLGAKPMDEWTVYRLAGESLEHLANESIEIQ